MTTLQRRSAALLCAILVFCAVLLAAAAIVPWLLTLVYGWGHPGDASAGDSAGWALLLLSPLLMPLTILVGALAGFLTYRAVSKRIGTS